MTPLGRLTGGEENDDLGGVATASSVPMPEVRDP